MYLMTLRAGSWWFVPYWEAEDFTVFIAPYSQSPFQHQTEVNVWEWEKQNKAIWTERVFKAPFSFLGFCFPWQKSECSGHSWPTFWELSTARLCVQNSQQNTVCVLLLVGRDLCLPSALQSCWQRFPDHPRDGPAHLAAHLAAVQLLWHRKAHSQQFRAAIQTHQVSQTWQPSSGSQWVKMPGCWTELPCTVNETQEESQNSLISFRILFLGRSGLSPSCSSACTARVLFPSLSKIISCPNLGLQEPTVIHLDSTWTPSQVNALQLLSSNSGAHPFWSSQSCRFFKGRADAHGPSSLLLSDFLTGLTVHSVHKSFMQIRHCILKRWPRWHQTAPIGIIHVTHESFA